MEVRPYLKPKTKPEPILPSSSGVTTRPTIVRGNPGTGLFRGWGPSL